MAKNKAQLRIVTKSSPTEAAPRPTVSPRWLLSAIGITVLAAGVCAWASLCLLLWQGNWQLLYHPSSTVARTPASIGLPFESVAFAATDTGQLRMQGWWIPAPAASSLSRYTVLYLHGQNGNLGDTVDALAQVHAAGVNVFAFDYRGYGRSVFVRPSEAHWRQDADWALDYLTGTRHIDPHAIVLVGDRLGANLALEVAAAHPQLAGVVLQMPLSQPMSVVFNDPRAHLVPAHALVHDRYDLGAAAAGLQVPSLWFLPTDGSNDGLAAYRKDPSQKMLVKGMPVGKEFEDTLKQWLNELRR